MINWIKEAKVGIIVLALAIGALLTVSACSGNTVEDFVKYKNPPGVQEAVKVPETQTLRMAEYTVAEWELYVTQNTKALMENVGRAEEIAGLVSGILTGGIDLILENEAISNSMYGGLITLALGTFGGLFLPRPSEGKKIRTEKEASFNAGQKKAQALLDAGKVILNDK
jgi:hypothetical protein